MSKLIKPVISIDGGEPLERVFELSLTQPYDNHHSFVVSVPIELLQAENGPYFVNIHSNLFGKPINISFADYEQNKPFSFVFKGLITSVTLSTGNVQDKILIQGYGTSVLFDQSKAKQCFSEKTLKFVVDTVTKDVPANLAEKKVNISNDRELYFNVRYNETAYQFITRMCSEYGLNVFYDGRTTHIGRLPQGKTATYNVDTFQSLTMQVAMSNRKSNIRSNDYVKNERYFSDFDSAGKPSGNKMVNDALDASEQLFTLNSDMYSSMYFKAESELKGVHTEKLKTAYHSYLIVSGKGERPDFNPGDILNINRIRLQKNGKTTTVGMGTFRVISIDHMLNEGGQYENRFVAIPSEIEHLSYNGPVPIFKSEIANVSNLEDPNKLGRVKVKFKWETDHNETNWIRVLSQHGAEGDGINFVPEKDSEVIVIAEAGLNVPVVLGNLWHGKPKDKPLVEYTNGSNETKVIATRSGNRIEFIDKGKPEILITNKKFPKNLIKIIFSNSGEIEILTDGKIKMEAKDEISLKSKTIKMQADSLVEIESKAKMDIKAGNLTQKVNGKTDMSSTGPLNVKGSSLVEVTAGAIMTIKGSLVKIN
jgi:type VI secretion system secreted protein VgrG